ncbi:hypothetical protein AHiyo1_38950 [Arthrobacter sp. Hiyo1]|nr:hypothetical protein AHiyo1_38950 [Arthrobacter sp. Hiyo1]
MFALDEAFDPPIGIVALPQPWDRLACVLQIVELPLRHGVADQVFHPSGVVHLLALPPLFVVGGLEFRFFPGRHTGGADIPQLHGSLQPALERTVFAVHG